VTDPADQDRFSCPKCQRSLKAGSRNCPHCGSGIAIIHVEEKGGIVERHVAVPAHEPENVGDLDTFDIDDPPGGEG
jgi:predicted amidophosphoribosyltransferase